MSNRSSLEKADTEFTAQLSKDTDNISVDHNAENTQDETQQEDSLKETQLDDSSKKTQLDDSPKETQLSDSVQDAHQADDITGFHQNSNDLLEAPQEDDTIQTQQQQEQQEEDPDFDDFGDFDDEFVDAGTGDDDDFGDFDDFEPTQDPIEAPLEEPEEEGPKTPTEAELYADVLENRPTEIPSFIGDYLGRMWGDSKSDNKDDTVSSPIDLEENTADILSTPCSRDLWTKLSRDTVFYNPVTGSVGQFQWTRSETNRAYLNALGVTFNPEEKSPPLVHSPTGHANMPSVTKKRQSNIEDGKRSTIASASMPSIHDESHTHHRSASATGGLRVVTTKMDDSTKEAKKEAEQELELDIDIARAYCELTEETIRVFPDVKLNAMVTELTRLQRQAAEYLESLLDQREQLKMDAETYNDLISCIVGHAQRLHVQSKDGSPAMVSKKKKANGTFSNLMRRKTTTSTTQQSVSMGGGVVGVKQKGPTPKRTVSSASQVPTINEGSRRSM